MQLYNTQQFFAGTSGLVLPVPNKQGFPGEFRHKSRLAYYAFLFNSLEVNSSFYKVPRAATVARWAQEAGSNFTFTFKLYRGITHNKLLAFDKVLVKQFMQVINEAGQTKGCLLIQFPKSTPVNIKQLGKLLQCIQQNNKIAWHISVEFRNMGWYNDEVYLLLQKFGAGIVIHDMPGSYTPLLQPWTNHVYLRYHDVLGDYKGTYEQVFLQQQAAIIAEHISYGRAVYAYFNNTIGQALENVVSLKNYVGNLLPGTA